MTEERWLPVVGYEGIYEVSDLGRLKSVGRVIDLGRPGVTRPSPEFIRKPAICVGGYHQYLLHKGGEKKNRLISSLVLEAFVGPRPEGHEACHYPNGPEDNSLANLRWDTKKGNHNDRRKAGTIPQGETCYLSKLTEEKVREIRRAYTGRRGQAVQMGRRYGVSANTVKALVNRKTWKHVS